MADVIVVGLGAMGSASAYQLARRGLKVLALDRFSPPHDLGSSHGQTRVTRQAIGEGANYVPFVLRSHEIWREIEAETGEALLDQTGVLILSHSAALETLHHGKPSFLNSTVSAAERYGIPHEILSSAEIGARFPQFGLAGDESGYFEPGGGLVHPERCVAAQILLARRAGAEIRTGERVTAIETDGTGVRVTTDRGAYLAARVVLAAGGWTAELAGDLVPPLAVHRQVLFWFEPADPAPYGRGRFPVFIWMHGAGAGDYLYGFPIQPGDRGIKVATEVYDDPASHPDTIRREVEPGEADAMFRTHVAGRLRGVTAACSRSQTCFYTATADSDFLVDRSAHDDRIVVVSACSGHGFKHSAAIGEAVADLVADGRPRLDLGGFGLARFGDRARAGHAALAPT